MPTVTSRSPVALAWAAAEAGLTSAVAAVPTRVPRHPRRCAGRSRHSSPLPWARAAFPYDHPATDGYFAPKRYVLSELQLRWGFGGALGWRVESDVGIGDQMITAFDNSTAARFAQRASASVLYRPAPEIEWGVSGGFANVASPTTISSADYRAYTLAIKGRVRL